MSTRDVVPTRSHAERMALSVPMSTSVITVLSMTAQQRDTLQWKVRAYTAADRPGRTLGAVSVWLGAYGLPGDYVYVIFRWADGSELHGGIDPEGRMST